MAWRSQITAPAAEVITWAQAQKQLRLDGLDDDAAFVEDIVIPAARDRMELATRRAASDQTWDQWLDAFPCERHIEIPLPPLVSVTYVKYVNTSGTVTTLVAETDYLVSMPVGPRCRRGRVSLPEGVSWPPTRRQVDAVVIRFRCGYVDQSEESPVGPARTVPPLLLAGMLMDVAALYEHRASLIADSKGAAQAIALPAFSREIYQKFVSYPTQRLRDGRLS